MTELRIYTLADATALRRYTTIFWPRHIHTLRRYGIVVHGVWTDTTADGCRVMALVGYPPGEDPTRLAEDYRASRDFAEDHAEFAVSSIISEQTVTLEPIAASPLR
ncbi:NIPSNAP domain-containing protein [Mycobacterium manitobense]|uniref:NIPSNAP domain-containing protein n=1 Tax=[Mycobacterium] manitobense TaxID=190147 RepID=A0A9X2YP06_9MYCO|nr:NIPSNAP domain-containing protein [[Mycobacterium] manitobense]MCV7170721.1 NIPSNAP domain-containing protein [[Mycobacterium] manitobense]